MTAFSIDSILDVALPLIKEFEGLKLKPYLCSANVPTIGYGSTFYLDGTKVTLDDPPITVEMAEKLLRESVLKVFLPPVLRLCPTLDSINMIAAITSWTYNLGAKNLESSTMRKRILERRWDAATVELKKWNKAGGKVLRGLINRRNKEAALFQS